MPAAGDPVILARMPGYRVATTVITSDSATFTTTETEVASVTASLISGVTYKVVFDGTFEVSSADSTLRAALRQDNVSGTQMDLVDLRLLQGVSATVQYVRIYAEYTASSTGPKTFVATGDLISGAGTANLNASSTIPSYLYVEVIG